MSLLKRRSVVESEPSEQAINQAVDHKYIAKNLSIAQRESRQKMTVRPRTVWPR